MSFYSAIFTANFKGFKEKLRKVAKENNKSYSLLLLDTYYSILRYGVGLTDYLNYEFYNIGHEERKEYAGTRDQNTFYELVSPSAYKLRYTIKPDFMADFAKYTKRDFVVPGKDSDERCITFVKSHEAFMSKPYDGLGGASVEKVKSAEISNVEEYIKKCAENRIFLEEVVVQHEGMNLICPVSCNTCRVMTFNNNGTPEILWAGLRVGNGTHAVDNFHAGGMCAPIDLETGKITNAAVDRNHVAFTNHPMTNVPFVGFQVPCWDEVKEMVKQASLESDKILVVGWDVAISENGPQIIEGNRRPGFDIVQVASRRGRKDIMRHCLDAIGKKL